MKPASKGRAGKISPAGSRVRAARRISVSVKAGASGLSHLSGWSPSVCLGLAQP